MAPIIAASIPLLLKALASPIVAGTAASWVASKFGLSDSTVNGIVNFINGLKPDDQLKVKELDLNFQKFLIEQDNKVYLAELGLLQGQLEINKIEALHQSLFVAGWRPFVGWVCGTGFLYCTLLEPFLRFIATVIFGYKGVYPVIDTAILVNVLLAILGMAALRSQDKKNGVGNG